MGSLRFRAVFAVIMAALMALLMSGVQAWVATGRPTQA